MISKNGFVFELSMMLQYLTFIRDLLIIIINKDNIKIIKNRKQLITWISCINCKEKKPLSYCYIETLQNECP
jgi:hypothetical protein